LRPWQVVRREVSAPRLCRCREHGLEIRRSLQAAEHRRGGAAALADLDRRQALAPLSAPGVEHGPAASRLHTDKKPVRTGAANLGGLVGAFHSMRRAVDRGRDCTRPRSKRVTNCVAEEERLHRQKRRPILLSARPGTRFHSNLPRQFGKSRIRAKSPFWVKHLHGNSRICTTLDDGTRTVDNRAWREGLSYNRAAQKTTCPQ